MTKEKILLVDDEKDIIEFLSYNLTKAGFEVSSCTNGKDAIGMAKKINPDLILLDVMMPDMDGVDTCYEIRETKGLKNVLIAFLSARGDDYTQTAGFEAGADSYITKPIKPELLIGKVKAILRRRDCSEEILMCDSVGHIKIDRAKRLVYLADNEFSIPRKEFELLALLISKPGKVFTREEILESIWGELTLTTDRTIDVHVRKIREKLGDNCIQTIKGVGYKFKT